jgi:hypothetical protein
VKTGDRTLTIIGDYFSPRFVPEILATADALSLSEQRVFLCTETYAGALRTLLTGRGITNIMYRTVDPSSPVLTRWARDLVVAGTRNGRPVLILSPDKHANDASTSEALRVLLHESFPERSVEVAPFVFEGGNVAFVNAGNSRALLVGRKVIFDNEIYERSRGAELDRAALIETMRGTFGADTVVVLGQATEPPDVRLYFEYHIDMGLVVLEGRRAVVSQLRFGEADEAELERAARLRAPVLSRYAFLDEGDVAAKLAERLHVVSREYEEYTEVLEGLGVEVHRSPVEWEHVLASMSWTNVVQAGGRILMPLYPDSLRGVTTATASEGGRTRLTVDVSGVDGESFDLSGDNLRNYELYRDLGYDVVPVPEYLHYMGGGLHCFVNVLE